MKHTCRPEGVCSESIVFELDEGIVREIRFEGGCHGNLQGLAKLADGKKAAEIADLLSGIECEDKGTSCPDQLARALKAALKNHGGCAAKK
ncbi:MAG: TIGR03905 family TSCPD domain-containing protein [Candidatus Adiutrix sp.]|jgi:uncharacterized protein (TIGR03905 family)|nr:TIGR03905 family TSCPD domain-containing protein [Candidatus Adiutrix sp.]